MEEREAIAAFNARFPRNRIEVCREAGGTKIAVSGSLDFEVGSALTGILVTIIETCVRGETASIDLAGVDYISSTGVGSLSVAVSTAGREGVDLVVRGLREPVRRVLATLGMLSYMNILE